MISILFCVVTTTFSRVFNDEMIVCDIIFFFVFLIHFAISKSCFEKLFEIYIVVLKLFFFVLFHDLVFLIISFDVRLSLAKDATFAF